MPSTVIRSFEYNKGSHALDIEFVTGRRYRYLNVPIRVAEEFQSAFSKGRFFNARIRDEYPCAELTPEPEDWSEEWA